MSLQTSSSVCIPCIKFVPPWVYLVKVLFSAFFSLTKLVMGVVVYMYLKHSTISITNIYGFIGQLPRIFFWLLKYHFWHFLALHRE